MQGACKAWRIHFGFPAYIPTAAANIGFHTEAWSRGEELPGTPNGVWVFRPEFSDAERALSGPRGADRAYEKGSSMFDINRLRRAERLRKTGGGVKRGVLVDEDVAERKASDPEVVPGAFPARPGSFGVIRARDLKKSASFNIMRDGFERGP